MFASLDEVGAWIKVRDQALVREIYELSQQKVYDAWESSDVDVKISLAFDALELCPANADAIGLLGKFCDVGDAVEHWLYAVRVAELLHGKPSTKFDGKGTVRFDDRTYMRVSWGLSDALWKAGRSDEAADHWKAMLLMDGRDGGGYRYYLSFYYTSKGDWTAAQKVLPLNSDDGSGWFLYQRALLGFMKKKPKADAWAREAIECNRFVVELMPLLHEFEVAEVDSYSHGGLYEALVYVKRARDGWVHDPEAIQWLYGIERLMLREQREVRTQELVAKGVLRLEGGPT
ncbi:MAG: hypothetical protein IPL18_13655 [Sphingomonadales bacterium]|nr:hypothetical protein [Sphingomonadales bacterium]